jgi:transposase
MGERTVAQNALFYSFNLERDVPADHLQRSIDRFVDLLDIREHVRPFYSETGRPSIDSLPRWNRQRPGDLVRRN